ncbi:hypothetical protein CP973_00345 [Streptomyces albofaciens JCM 4342]|uniref:hypothetical protein n=1 Tax=Streptomyces albofaciens TaxID=66866 RepID=UPI00123BD54F|nr:hypothetical protein [Streptomyces albofaciens]KAA6220607.1 hypothetical protein CP973_00100 [Streptomyces albofaciens JCM 4342]KAA6220650.1 hypothetical protein CP973_00345 [Streptomyces albofaciens JCM 4342]
MSPENKRTTRTILQTIIAFALALPAIIDASGIPDTLPWVAGALAVAGGLTRVMALPQVEAQLDRVGLGLVDDQDPARKDGGGV